MRIIIASILSFFATSGLFILMQFLIITDQEAPKEPGEFKWVNIYRVPDEPVVDIIKEEPQKPPQPETEPRPPIILKPGTQILTIGTDTIVSPTRPSVDSSVFGRGDGSYLPVVKVQPSYPRRALSRGMSGWVVVEFTVTTNGTVRDAYVVTNCAQTASTDGSLCSESPNRVFDKSALSAVTRFKYMPRVVDGENVATLGVQNRIVFALATN